MDSFRENIQRAGGQITTSTLPRHARPMHVVNKSSMQNPVWPRGSCPHLAVPLMRQAAIKFKPTGHAAFSVAGLHFQLPPTMNLPWLAEVLPATQHKPPLHGAVAGFCTWSSTRHHKMTHAANTHAEHFMPTFNAKTNTR